MTDYGPVPCPTCGAKGEETCIRGRQPFPHAGVTAATWMKQEPFPQGHDSRRTANKPQPMNFDEMLELAEVIGDKIARGELPPKDKNGFYILP